MSDTGLDPVTSIQDISGTICKCESSLKIRKQYYISVNFLVLIISLWLYNKMFLFLENTH